MAKHSIIRQHVNAADTTPSTKKTLTQAAEAAYGNEPVLVHMYGSWCPHCISMTDDMNDALSALRSGAIMTAPTGYKVTVLQVESALLADDADDSRLVSDLRGLGRPGGYPYIALVGRDAGVQEHKGDRSAKGLIAFLLDALHREVQRCGPVTEPAATATTRRRPSAKPKATPRKASPPRTAAPRAARKKALRSPRVRRTA